MRISSEVLGIRLSIIMHNMAEKVRENIRLPGSVDFLHYTYLRKCVAIDEQGLFDFRFKYCYTQNMQNMLFDPSNIKTQLVDIELWIYDISMYRLFRFERYKINTIHKINLLEPLFCNFV